MFSLYMHTHTYQIFSPRIRVDAETGAAGLGRVASERASGRGPCFLFVRVNEVEKRVKYATNS